MSGALAVAATTCGPTVTLPPRDGAVELREVRAPEGAPLEEACTPSGVELCFDARDNNCNGVLDEGCGVRTGILQFTIAWPAPEADVDLLVTDAAGELAKLGAVTAGGLVKDRDCPGTNEDCRGQNVENVYLDDGDPRRGRYRVVVRLDKLNGARPPVKIQLGARVGQRTYHAAFELSAPNEERSFELVL